MYVHTYTLKHVIHICVAFLGIQHMHMNQISTKDVQEKVTSSPIRHIWADPQPEMAYFSLMGMPYQAWSLTGQYGHVVCH
jgi:hypothetical protein